jgi:hypothetical protein
VNVSAAPTATNRWPDNDSRARTRSHTVPLATATCSPSVAPPATNQLLVGADVSQTESMRVRSRHWRYEVHIVRGPTLAQRVFHMRPVHHFFGRQGLHHGHHRRALSRMRQGATYGQPCIVKRRHTRPCRYRKFVHFTQFHIHHSYFHVSIDGFKALNFSKNDVHQILYYRRSVAAVMYGVQIELWSV